MSVIKQKALTVESNLSQLPIVVEWFTQFKQSVLPHERWLQANMALIEGFTNAVRHAHHSLRTAPPISLEAGLSSELFWFEIWDRGSPYNLDEALDHLQNQLKSPDFDPIAREKQWGSVIFLKLIHQYGWSIQYLRHADTMNCLRAQVILPVEDISH